MTAEGDKILTELGFTNIEHDVYFNKNLGRGIDFTGKASKECIVACIWDTAQHYGEEKKEREIVANILRKNEY
jgi:hypothetical protein